MVRARSAPSIKRLIPLFETVIRRLWEASILLEYVYFKKSTCSTGEKTRLRRGDARFRYVILRLGSITVMYVERFRNECVGTTARFSCDSCLNDLVDYYNYDKL